jgi:hypothetical protein
MDNSSICFSIVAVNSLNKDQAEYTRKEWNFIKTKNNNLDFYRGSLTQSEPSSVIDGTPFFHSSWYTWISEKFLTSYKVEIRGKTENADAKDFAYIEHAGALLCAVDSGDSLLAAEIFHKHKSIFLEYPELTKKIVKKIAVEGLFTWIWGNFSDNLETKLSRLMHSSQIPEYKNWDVTEMFYYSAKEILYPENTPEFSPLSETPSQMITRFFKNNKNLKITLGLVGTSFYPWISQNLLFFEKRLQKMETKDIKLGTDFAKKTRHRIFSNTHSVIKAEPANPFDKNAISVYLDDIKSKAQGKYRLMQAGYIRSKGAEIIRNSRPDVLKFESNLARISTVNGEKNIVLELIV